MKNKKEDIIIIGSGIGGLSSAAYLSKRGYKVKIFEKLNVAGGYINTFKRKDYYFENSTHFISFDPQVLKLLGLKDIDLLKVKDSFEAFFIKNDIIDNRIFFKSGKKNLINNLSDKLNINKDDMKKIYNSFEKIGYDIKRLHRVLFKAPFANLFDMITALFYIMKDKKSILQKIGKLSYKHIDKVIHNSFNDFLNGINNPHLKSIFKLVSSVCFVLPSTEYFGTVGVFLNWAYLLSPSVWIKGGTKNIINGLIEIVNKNNGTICYNSQVKKVIIKNNKACGVILDDNEEYYADYVISNVNASLLYKDLIQEKDSYSDDLLDKLEKYTPSSSIFQVYLGLPFLLKDYGYNGSANVFYNDYDTDKYFINDTDHDNPEFFVMTNYSAIDPSYSKAGKSSIVISTKSDYKNWDKLDKNDYKKEKLKFEKNIIEKMMKLTGLPLNKAEVVFSATPVTMKRYSGNINGGIMGLEPSMNYRDRFPCKSDIKNLFVSGADSGIGGGFNGSLYSGIVSAKRITMPFLNY